MDKPVADKLNPAHDAVVRRMLAAAVHPPNAEREGARKGNPQSPHPESLRRGPSRLKTPSSTSNSRHRA